MNGYIDHLRRATSSRVLAAIAVLTLAGTGCTDLGIGGDVPEDPGGSTPSAMPSDMPSAAPSDMPSDMPSESEVVSEPAGSEKESEPTEGVPESEPPTADEAMPITAEQVVQACSDEAARAATAAELAPLFQTPAEVIEQLCSQLVEPAE